MTGRIPTQLLFAVVTVTLVTVILGLLAAMGAASRARSSAALLPNRLAQQGETVSGRYVGEVELERVVVGEYDDALPAPTAGATVTPGASTTLEAAPDLGTIAMALVLQQSGQQVEGYVDLGETLVYSVTGRTRYITPEVPPLPGTPPPTPHAIAVGPTVGGRFETATLSLESEAFDHVIAPERELSDNRVVPEQRVRRQFRLTATSVTDKGDVLSGEYRETIWNYAQLPYTVIGQFTLQRPGSSAADLPEAATPAPGSPSATPSRASTASPTLSATPGTAVPTSRTPTVASPPSPTSDAPSPTSTSSTATADPTGPRVFLPVALKTHAIRTR